MSSMISVALHFGVQIYCGHNKALRLNPLLLALPLALALATIKRTTIDFVNEQLLQILLTADHVVSVALFFMLT